MFAGRHSFDSFSAAKSSTNPSSLKSWVAVLRRLVEDKRIRKIFAFANNHYAGHAPATVKQFFELWDKGK